jgi:uncharacterized repeat protein (TIGR01451 family)
MFKKLVSNLAFSPALVGQLGFYAKRLRKEEATRRAGLIFVVLALIVQSFAVFSPPESADAANGDNVIYSGIRDKNDLLAIYDSGVDSAGRRDIQQIYTQFGVTRQDLANTHLGSYNTGDFNGQIQSVGRSDWGVSFRHPVKVEGPNTTVYTGGFTETYGRSWPMPALIGKRAVDGQWFAITLSCGNVVYVTPPPPVKHTAAACSNLVIAPISRTSMRFSTTSSVKDGATISGYTYTVKNASGAVIATHFSPSTAVSDTYQQTLSKDGNYTVQVIVTTSVGDKADGNCAKPLTISPEPRCALNNGIVASSADCKPCLNDNKIWYKDDSCVAAFTLTKSVRNISQGLSDANNTTAKPGDQLQYTLTVKNTGKDQGSYTMADNVTDILEYADVIDAGDGKLSSPTVTTASATPATVQWPALSIKPGEAVQKILLVRVKAVIPAMATNLSNAQSYNCQVTNTFGNTINVGVQCPPEKVAEQVVMQLPHTGPTQNMIFSGIVLAIVVYFYARARQTATEIRLIRREVNAGTI